MLLNLSSQSARTVHPGPLHRHRHLQQPRNRPIACSCVGNDSPQLVFRVLPLTPVLDETPHLPEVAHVTKAAAANQPVTVIEPAAVRRSATVPQSIPGTKSPAVSSEAAAARPQISETQAPVIRSVTASDNATVPIPRDSEDRLEASMRSQLLDLQIGAIDQGNLSDKVASKYEVVMNTLNAKFSKLAEEQGQLQSHTAGLAKQLHTALIELEKLLADRLEAEQQATAADVELQRSALELEVASAQRDAAIEQAQKLKSIVQVWEGKNQRLAAQLRAARQDVSDLSESQVRLEARFLEMYEKREQLQRRVEASEEGAEQAQETVQQLQAQVSELTEELSAQSASVDVLSGELAAAKGLVDKAQQQQRELAGLLEAAQSEARETGHQLNVERQRSQALRAQVASGEASHALLQQQLQALQQQVSDLQCSSAATKSQLLTQLAEGQRYTSRLRQQLQQTTYQHDMISESNHQLLERLEQAGAEIKLLNEQLTQARSAPVELQVEQGTGSNGAGPAGQLEAAELQDRLESTSIALRAVDHERKTYHITNQQLRAQVTQLDGQKQRLTDEHAALQQEIQRLKQQQQQLEQQQKHQRQQQQELQQLEAVNSWMAARTALMEAYTQRHATRHSTMALVAYANSNRFWVPENLRVRFLKAWMEREQRMVPADGFLGLGVREQGQEVCVSSLWLSVAGWEAWALSSASRRSHLPDGVQQFVPKKGEGFPEDFIPFKDYAEPVNARYE